MELRPQDPGIRLGSVGRESHFQKANKELGYLLVQLPHFPEEETGSEKEEDLLVLSFSHFPRCLLSGSISKSQMKIGVGQVLALLRSGSGSLMSSE